MFNALFNRLALLGLLSLFAACSGSDNGTDKVTKDLVGITADRVALQFTCTVTFTADIQASDEGKRTSVSAFLTEAVLRVTSSLLSLDVLEDPSVLANALDDAMTARTEGAPSTSGLFTFDTTCSDVHIAR